MTQHNKRSRTFMFTWNNYNDDSLDCLKALANSTEYMIVGSEVGEQGTPHYQGYCRFRSARTLKSVIKKMMVKGKKKEDGTNNSANVEIADGGDQANLTYCSKEGDVVLVHGEPAAQGKRSDLLGVRELIKKGGTMRDVISEATSYQGLRAAPIYLTYLEPKRHAMPTVVWLWGRTGTGKTRGAREWLPDAWMSGKNLKWWNDYDGHKDIIVDDFRGDFCTLHYLLRILDRYPMSVEVKGGHRQLVAERIVITSPVPPQAAYPNSNERMEQLIRRITEKGFIKEVKNGVDIEQELKMTQKNRNDTVVCVTGNGEVSPVTRVTELPNGMTQKSGVIIANGAGPDRFALPSWTPSDCGLTDLEWLMDVKEGTDYLDEVDEETYNRLIAWARGNGFVDEEIRAKTIGGWILMLEWAKSNGFTDYS